MPCQGQLDTPKGPRLRAGPGVGGSDPPAFSPGWPAPLSRPRGPLASAPEAATSPMAQPHHLLGYLLLLSHLGVSDSV